MSSKTTFNLAFMIITIATVTFGFYQNLAGIGTGVLFIAMLTVYVTGDNPEN